MHTFDEYVSHIRRQKIDELIRALEQQLQGTDVRSKRQTLISELGFWRAFR
ncbi:MAG: hypothetical protein ACFB0C_21700 [Leptolyngbyaceae cyanobacterium]